MSATIPPANEHDSDREDLFVADKPIAEIIGGHPGTKDDAAVAAATSSAPDEDPEDVDKKVCWGFRFPFILVLIVCVAIFGGLGVGQIIYALEWQLHTDSRANHQAVAFNHHIVEHVTGVIRERETAFFLRADALIALLQRRVTFHNLTGSSTFAEIDAALRHVYLDFMIATHLVNNSVQDVRVSFTLHLTNASGATRFYTCRSGGIEKMGCEGAVQLANQRNMGSGLSATDLFGCTMNDSEFETGAVTLHPVTRVAPSGRWETNMSAAVVCPSVPLATTEHFLFATDKGHGYISPHLTEDIRFVDDANASVGIHAVVEATLHADNWDEDSRLHPFGEAEDGFFALVTEHGEVVYSSHEPFTAYRLQCEARAVADGKSPKTCTVNHTYAEFADFSFATELFNRFVGLGLHDREDGLLFEEISTSVHSAHPEAAEARESASSHAAVHVATVPMHMVVIAMTHSVPADLWADVMYGIIAGTFVIILVVTIWSYATLAGPLKHFGQVMMLVTQLELSKAHEQLLHQRYVFRETSALNRSLLSLFLSVKLFTQYVPKEVVRDLMGAADAQKGMQIRSITVMFTDIAGFTTICESVPTDDLVSLLDAYFSSMLNIVLKHGGCVDKCIGDAVMALWGAPLDHHYAAFSACCAALHMQAAITGLQPTFLKFGFELMVRVGVHLGLAAVGNVGCEERKSYTALGDTVNTASRLEGINKYYRTKVLVSGSVAHTREASVFVFRQLGSVVLKGRTEGLLVYELVGIDAAAAIPSWILDSHSSSKSQGGGGMSTRPSMRSLKSVGSGRGSTNGGVTKSQTYFNNTAPQRKESVISTHSAPYRQIVNIDAVSVASGPSAENLTPQVLQPAPKTLKQTRAEMKAGGGSESASQAPLASNAGTEPTNRRTKCAELPPDSEIRSVGAKYLLGAHAAALVRRVNAIVDEASKKERYDEAAHELQHLLRLRNSSGGDILAALVKSEISAGKTNNHSIIVGHEANVNLIDGVNFNNENDADLCSSINAATNISIVTQNLEEVSPCDDVIRSDNKLLSTIDMSLPSLVLLMETLVKAAAAQRRGQLNTDALLYVATEK